MRKLGIEFLGAFGISPVDLVHIAADLDCSFISTPLEPLDYNPEAFSRWSLRNDGNLRRDLKAASAERHVGIELGEGFALLPGMDVQQAYAEDLDIFCDLGVNRVNSLCFDPDLGRSLDQFAVLAEMARDRGLDPVLEFFPLSTINTLPLAIQAVRHAGHGAALMLDTMHFYRTGCAISELPGVGEDLVGHVQLSDVPARPVIADYMEEAMFERMAPGQGDAPLVEIVAAVPAQVPIGLEVPLRTRAEAGMSVKQRMAICVAGAKDVIRQADLVAKGA